MANYNRIILMGNLTRDPELKYLPSGTAVTNVGVAVNRTYTDRQSGERREEVCFVDLVAFGRTAETVNEYLQKGRQILVEGRLRHHTWETDDGQKRGKHDVLIDRFEFVDSRQDVGSRQDSGESLRDEGAGYSASDEPPPTEDDIPF
jgi:single-strand DNA-binding protein